jgi:hypothetical protein
VLESNISLQLIADSQESLEARRLGGQKVWKPSRFKVSLRVYDLSAMSYELQATSSFGVTDWLFYEKCLPFVKQWILKRQLSLKRRMKKISAKTQGSVWIFMRLNSV